MPNTMYFHAGIDGPNGVTWSRHTRRSRQAVEREAWRMWRAAPPQDCRPLIEWWPRSAGLRPGDQDVREGVEYLDTPA